MIYFIISIPVLLYVLIWSYFIIGATKKVISNHNKDQNDLSISIIVPFRNEKERIGPLLSSLDQLDSFACNLNIFFIDDHSEDKGLEQLMLWKNKTNKKVEILQLKELDEEGKKKALKKAIEQSKDEWIFTLDADSTISIDFLQEFKKEMTNNKEAYLLPVLEMSNGFFLSVIESYMLSVIALASAKNKKPLLANGTGLIFKRALFLKLDPYKENYHIASGDDIFLLEKITREEPDMLMPISNRKLIVYTDSPLTYKKMLNRSCRWVGKMSKSNLHLTRLVGLIVLICNLSIILTLIFQIIDNDFKVLWVVIASKLIIDVLLFTLAIKYYGNRQLILITPLVFLLYPIHLVCVMFNLLISDKIWKGRKI